MVFLLALRIGVEPAAFKDYAQYLDYLSSIKTEGLWAGGLDLASNFMFYLAGQFFSDREDALAALYFYLFLVFLLFLKSEVFSVYFCLGERVEFVKDI